MQTRVCVCVCSKGGWFTKRFKTPKDENVRGCLIRDSVVVSCTYFIAFHYLQVDVVVQLMLEFCIDFFIRFESYGARRNIFLRNVRTLTVSLRVGFRWSIKIMQVK